MTRFLDHHPQQEGEEGHSRLDGEDTQFFRQLGDVVGLHGSLFQSEHPTDGLRLRPRRRTGSTRGCCDCRASDRAGDSPVSLSAAKHPKSASSFPFPRDLPPLRGGTAGGASSSLSRRLFPIACGGHEAPRRRTLATTAPRASAGVRHQFSSGFGRMAGGARYRIGVIPRSESGSLTAGRIDRAASARSRHHFQAPDNRVEVCIKPAPGIAHRFAPIRVSRHPSSVAAIATEFMIANNDGLFGAETSQTWRAAP